MLIYADRARHLVTVPYTREALLAAADRLSIPRHWYHAHTSHPHIDIPVRQSARILSDPRVVIVTSREIVRMEMLR